MRIALIGATGHYGTPVQAVAADADLHWIGGAPGPSHEGYDPPTMDAAAKVISERGGSLPIFEDYRDLLDRQPDIAVVSPWYCDTAQVAIEAISRGVAVYAEKPLATTLEDLDRLENALFGKGLRGGKPSAPPKARLTAMLEIRYQPWFAAAKRAAEEGKLGEIRLMTGQKSYKLGARPDFYRSRALYGGTIAWVGIHAFDWALWFSGKRLCWAEGAYNRDPDHWGEMELSAVAQLGLEGGALASFQLDYLHQPSAKRHDDDRLRVVGTRGTIEIRDQVAYLETAETAMTALAPEPAVNPFADFVASLCDGTACRVPEEDALAATYAVLLATAAADRGGRMQA